MGSRAKAATARLHRKEGLSPRRLIQLAAEKERKGGELERIKILVDGEEMKGVARAKTIRQLGERETLTQQVAIIFSGFERRAESGEFVVRRDLIIN